MKKVKTIIYQILTALIISRFPGGPGRSLTSNPDDLSNLFMAPFAE